MLLPSGTRSNRGVNTLTRHRPGCACPPTETPDVERNELKFAQSPATGCVRSVATATLCSVTWATAGCGQRKAATNIVAAVRTKRRRKVSGNRSRSCMNSLLWPDANTHPLAAHTCGKQHRHLNWEGSPLLKILLKMQPQQRF